MVSTEATRKACTQLEKALRFAQGAEGSDRDLFEQFRNSVIQTFEYSWELSTKLLRRFLAEAAASADEVLSLSFPDLLRLAADRGLIDSVETWLGYRTIRNKTSHSYEEEYAAVAYENAGPFLLSALDLITRIDSR